MRLLVTHTWLVTPECAERIPERCRAPSEFVSVVRMKSRGHVYDESLLDDRRYQLAVAVEKVADTQPARVGCRRRGGREQHPVIEADLAMKPDRVVDRRGVDVVVPPRQPMCGDDRVEGRGVRRVDNRGGVQQWVVGHLTAGA